jgi:hypothetical protein
LVEQTRFIVGGLLHVNLGVPLGGSDFIVSDEDESLQSR